MMMLSALLPALYRKGCSGNCPRSGRHLHSHPLLLVKYYHKNEAGSGGRLDAPRAVGVSQQEDV